MTRPSRAPSRAAGADPASDGHALADASIRLLAGPAARRRIAESGLGAADVAAVAAAAGGPKGLALLPLDRWLFGEWFAGAPRPRAHFGASIGAWRMAAATRARPLPALDRLQHAYVEGQRYPSRPSPEQVSRVCRDLVRELFGGDTAGFVAAAAPGAALHVVTARDLTRRPAAHPTESPGSGASTAPVEPAERRESDARVESARRPPSVAPGEPAGRGAFARAALANALGRPRLAAHLQRVVFSSAPDGLAALPRDAFATRVAPLDAASAEDALLASGSIPLVARPVRSIHGAPVGDYWDGGLIDYHLYWRYARLDGLVLYPHFVPWLTAGWLDKFLPWRRHGIGGAGRGWIDNLVLLAPGPDLLQRLPNRALPDRRDFHRHGLDHDGRLRAWRHAIGECARMAEAFARFVERPDPGRIEAL